jgi:hypothetical protein
LRDANAHTDSNSYAYADSYANFHGHGHRHANADANTDSDTYSDGNADSYRDGDTNTDTNADSHSYGHGDSAAAAHPDDDAQTYADAQAAADASSAGALIGTLKAGTRERNLASSLPEVKGTIAASQRRFFTEGNEGNKNHGPRTTDHRPLTMVPIVHCPVVSHSPASPELRYLRFLH